MKNLLLLISCLFIFGCEIKKDLATANESNTTLTEKVKELESKNQELAAENQKLRGIASSNRAEIVNLRNKKKEVENSNQELRKIIIKLGGEIPENEDEIIEFIERPRAPVIEEIFTVVEQMPEFPGGEAKLFEFIMKNLKYPQQAKEANIRGKVYVQFVVRKDGSITDIKTVRGIGSGCDDEAMRVVKSMPKWVPGTQRGKPVDVRMILPVNFSLR